MTRPALHVVFALPLLAACAASGAEPPPSDESSSAFSAKPVSLAQCKAFVENHPSTESVTLSTGATAGVPFHACDLDSGAIFGTIDLAYARGALAGTGRVPIEVHRFGMPAAALARLYFVHYLTTDLGAYDEFIYLIDAVDENASRDAKVLTWIRPTSALLPAFDPKDRTFTPRLVLSKEAETPIAYGREVLALDKRGGTVNLDTSGGAFSFAVTDEAGKPVVRGELRPDKSILGLLGAMTRLGEAAVGELVTPADIQMKLHPLTLNQPIEVSAQSFSRDPLNDGAIKEMKTTYWWLPSMNEVSAQNFDFHLDASSALGKELSDAHFAPAAFVTADHVSILVSPQ